MEAKRRPKPKDSRWRVLRKTMTRSDKVVILILLGVLAMVLILLALFFLGLLAFKLGVAAPG